MNLEDLARRIGAQVVTRGGAAEEGVALFVSKDSAFEIVGRLYGLGLRGRHA